MDNGIKINKKLTSVVKGGRGGDKIIIQDLTSVYVEDTKLIFEENTTQEENNG